MSSNSYWHFAFVSEPTTTQTEHMLQQNTVMNALDLGVNQHSENWRFGRSHRWPSTLFSTAMWRYELRSNVPTFIIRVEVYQTGRSRPRKGSLTTPQISFHTENTIWILQLFRLLSSVYLNKHGSSVVCRVLVCRHSQLRIKMET